MKEVYNPNYRNSKFLYSFMVIMLSLPGIIFYWTFSTSEESNLMMVIPLYIILGFFILSFTILQGMIPHKIIMKNNELILRSKLKITSMKIKDFKGYDVDFNNNIRLIKMDSKNKTKILSMALIDRKTQREITKYYDLKRYKFKINAPWGMEEEDEDIDEKQNKRFSFTINTFFFAYTIILAPIFATLIFIFLANDIDLIFIIFVFGVIMLSVILLLMLAHKKGWIKREPIREKK